MKKCLYCRDAVMKRSEAGFVYQWCPYCQFTVEIIDQTKSVGVWLDTQKFCGDVPNHWLLCGEKQRIEDLIAVDHEWRPL